MQNNTENTGRSRRRKIVSNSYKGYQLGNEDAYDAKILDASIDIIGSSLENHSKVLAKRYDFHLPKDTPPGKSKEIISDVTAEIVRNFNRPRTRGVEKPRPSLDTRYIMVVEQHESDQPHIHAIFTFNANVMQSGYYPTQEIKEIVGRKLGNAALVHECRNGEFLLHRGNEEDMVEVIRATSYIAKTRTKESNQGREMMRSQLKRKKG
ncbi:MAG: inovirus-type Gp2 protein [Victivallales bacterium]|nr:inovirus-type Gp2 protein [Victivallales bacterium]